MKKNHRDKDCPCAHQHPKPLGSWHHQYQGEQGPAYDRASRDVARTVWTVTWRLDGHAGTNARTFEQKDAAKRFLRSLGKRRSVREAKLKPWRWSGTEQRRRRARRR